MDSVIEQMQHYKSFYKNGGGLTVTGGEPLMQADGVLELFKRVHSELGLTFCNSLSLVTESGSTPSRRYLMPSSLYLNTPIMQADGVLELFKRVHSELGLTNTIDTSCAVIPENINEILHYTDLVIVDLFNAKFVVLKHTHSMIAKQLILYNIRKFVYNFNIFVNIFFLVINAGYYGNN